MSRQHNEKYLLKFIDYTEGKWYVFQGLKFKIINIKIYDYIFNHKYLFVEVKIIKPLYLMLFEKFIKSLPKKKEKKTIENKLFNLLKYFNIENVYINVVVL
jgi:hypothetical protein